MMTKQKTFWHALATLVIPPILIWGTLLYVIGMRANDWIFYAGFILGTIVFLTPLVYCNYKNRTSSQKPTRDDYLQRALVTSCFAVAYSILAFLHPGYPGKAYRNWIMPIAWFVIAAIHLWRASKAEKTRYIPNER
ncbi:MAG TPA: hypothetical protein VGK22_23425 [Candidatus Angelobacter sp.]|jgi:hypothetical protein